MREMREMRDMRGGARMRVWRAGTCVCMCVCVCTLPSLPLHLHLSEQLAHANSDTDTHSGRHISGLTSSSPPIFIYSFCNCENVTGTSYFHLTCS